jgi:esterase
MSVHSLAQAGVIHLPTDVELHFIEAGRGDAVVLLHGGVGDCWSWPAQMDLLASHFRVIAYSRRYNFPNINIASERGYSCRIDAEDLGQFLQALGCRRTHLVGTSYGALTALQFALWRPQAVASLLLAEPPVMAWLARVDGGRSARAGFFQDVWQPARIDFERGQVRAAMRCLYDGMRGTGSFDLLGHHEQERILRNGPAMEKLVASTEPFPNLPTLRVGELTMPILLTTGESTVGIHRLCHAAAAVVLRSAERAVIPGSGHAPANENPSAFNRVLLAFLRACPRQGVNCSSRSSHDGF